MASVGFCVVTTIKRGYPPEDATHIALSKTHRHTQVFIGVTFILVTYSIRGQIIVQARTTPAVGDFPMGSHVVETPTSELSSAQYKFYLPL